ncbi:hypothetical protein BDP27DRAFT_1173611, partial [Rhodocollybia butyracea]
HAIQEEVIESFTLNNKQIQAFKIISSTVISRHVFGEPEYSNEEPLRMLLTGSGGTGKTRVVNAVKEVMRRYGIDHALRYMAPTGTAASLIGGTTIHKGLGI